MRSKELQKQLDEAKSTLELHQARRDGELSRLQQEICEGEEYFGRLIAKDKEDIERIENELKAEISKEKDSWKKWPQAELIRRWETGDFDYVHFKDTDNALILRHAYKACMPDAEARSISRIMRVSAQVAAGWYKTPLEAPHCNPHREKSDETPKATPIRPAKKTPAKASPAKPPPTSTTPSKNAPVKSTPAKATPVKTMPAKIGKTTPAKTAPAKANKQMTTPAKDTTAAKGSQAAESPSEKPQAKKSTVKKASKKDTTEKTSAEQTQTHPNKPTPAPVRGKKRAHDVTDELGEIEAQQQHAVKKVKITMKH